MNEEMEMPRSHMPNQVVSQNIFFKVWYLASQERFCGLLSILTSNLPLVSQESTHSKQK